MIPVIIWPESESDLRIAKQVYEELKLSGRYDPFVPVDLQGWENWSQEEIDHMKSLLVKAYIDGRKDYTVIMISLGEYTGSPLTF